MSKYNRARPFRPDRRTRAGRRIAELEAIFTEALGGDPSPLQREQIEHAAQMAVAAEISRDAFLREEIDVDGLVRVERAAALAIKQLGLKPNHAPKAPDLDSYLESKRGEQCA